MGFYKDCGGLFVYMLCQIEFIFQFFFIYQMNDLINNKQNIILTIHKIINYILLFLSVYSHIKTSIIDPGSITIKNNKVMVEFYYLVHEPLIKKALQINQKYNIEKQNINDKSDQKQTEDKTKENEEVEEEDEISDNDDYPFEEITSINDTTKKKVEEKYPLKLTRCINCFVIRPINSHHCSVCHKCYIGHDHHCPWVNNCIALFNKKVFILFLFYGLIEIIYSDILYLYYTLYKNIHKYYDNPLLILFDVFAIIFGLLLVISSTILLYDQYDTIIMQCRQYDYKKRKLLEISTIKHQLQMIFGGLFSYKWFLPFYPGGNSDFLKKLSDFLKIEKSLKNININKNNEKKEQIKDKFKNE